MLPSTVDHISSSPSPKAPSMLMCGMHYWPIRRLTTKFCSLFQDSIGRRWSTTANKRRRRGGHVGCADPRQHGQIFEVSGTCDARRHDRTNVAMACGRRAAIRCASIGGGHHARNAQGGSSRENGWSRKIFVFPLFRRITACHIGTPFEFEIIYFFHRASCLGTCMYVCS